MCFLCQSLDPKTETYDFHGLSNELDGASSESTVSAELPVYTLDQVALQLTHGYWQSQDRDWRAFDVQAGGTLTVNIDGLDPTGQAAALAALAAWTSVSGLLFEVTSGEADITFDDENQGAYSSSWVFPTWNLIDSSTVNVHTSWQDYGDYYHQTYIHEIGHALGLGHGGNYNGGASFETDAHYANDSWQMSVMSYFAQWENPNVTASGNYLATPMMADIVAIQNLYGTPTNVNTGDTVYGDNTTLTQLGMDLSRDWAMTIFDSAGTDLIDLGSRTYDQRLSLVAETFSDLNGKTGNFGIARDAVIENAITGSGNDEVIGNAGANHIRTGDGSDTLTGGEGDDTLDGGGGEDLLLVAGAPGSYSYTFDYADSAVLMTDVNLADGSEQGTDRLLGIETMYFADGYYGEVETDATTKTILFHVEGQVSATFTVQMDVTNSHDWSTIERTFDGNQSDSQVNVYDNGRILEIDFTQGVRTSATMTDAKDAYEWHSYGDTWDMAGNHLSNSLIWDNGKTVATIYSNSQISHSLVTDGGNLYAWHTIERIHDTTGALVQQNNAFDSGMQQRIDYTGGQRSSITMTDAADIMPWLSYTDSYDGTGARTARHLVYDDAREVSFTYSGGRIASSLTVDEADVFVWHSIERTWDDKGKLDTQVNTLDDGRVQEMDYVNGVRSSTVVTDTADVYDWLTQTDSYNQSGALVERVTHWDDGSETVVTFASDAPVM